MVVSKNASELLEAFDQWLGTIVIPADCLARPSFNYFEFMSSAQKGVFNRKINQIKVQCENEGKDYEKFMRTESLP